MQLAFGILASLGELLVFALGAAALLLAAGMAL